MPKIKPDPGSVRQIRLDYHARQDRLSVRINTTGRAEFRLWFTRHFTQGLWDMLMKVVASNPSVQSQSDPEARKEVIAFQHDSAVANATFQAKFDEGADHYPLGQDPLLVTGCKVTPNKGRPPSLTLETDDGQTLTFGLDDRILHSLCKLLIVVVKTTDWGLDLAGEFSASGTEGTGPTKVH